MKKVNGEYETNQLERHSKKYSSGSSNCLSHHQKNSLISTDYLQFNEDPYIAQSGMKSDGFGVEELETSENSSTANYG